MKIMVYNTQHCKSYMEQKIDYDLIASIIREQDPDFVGLNEIYGKGIETNFQDQTEHLSELTGMNHYYFAPAFIWRRTDPYGNAFLSKIPIREASCISIPNPPEGRHEPRAILKAKLECGLTVLVTHFGLHPEEQANAAKTVLENLESKNCILMGDFNVTPDDPVLQPIRACMKDTADLFAGPRLSFPSDNPTRKIDYIFVSPDIEVVRADIPAIVGSDHRPHIAEINVP